jgi:hypothetical protein
VPAALRASSVSRRGIPKTRIARLGSQRNPVNFKAEQWPQRWGETLPSTTFSDNFQQTCPFKKGVLNLCKQSVKQIEFFIINRISRNRLSHCWQR